VASEVDIRERYGSLPVESDPEMTGEVVLYQAAPVFINRFAAQ
jgi:hypothetical protein